MNFLRRVRRRLFPPPQAPPLRAVVARRSLDRLLLLATAASLVAAVLERRALRPGEGPGVALSPIPSFPVNLAADPPERLRLLPGLGPTRLAALLRERERSGAPSAWDDLEQVRGIGAKTLSAWRAAGATVDPTGASARPGAPWAGPEWSSADPQSGRERARGPPDSHAR